jgi:type II secretory pathway component PulF
MTSDVFVVRRCIHVKLSKDVHFAFRTRLLERGLTMQDAMDEFARLVADEDHRAMKIVERLAARNAQAELNAARAVPDRLRKVSELDAETLYNMINSGEEDGDQGQQDPTGDKNEAA